MWCEGPSSVSGEEIVEREAGPLPLCHQQCLFSPHERFGLHQVNLAGHPRKP